MYQQGTEDTRALSKRVSSILDVVGYSQEDRNRRLRCVTGWEFFCNIGNLFKPGRILKKYMFGSRGEGSTGPGLVSDQDILGESDKIRVVTDISDCQPDKLNCLMVYDEGTHPGYVKLQMVDILPDGTPDPKSFGRTVISNKFFPSIFPDEFSGPAVSTKHKIEELSRDYVTVLRCERWPNEAQEWFQRHRRHGWPKSHDVEKARRDCCFATGVGHPQSDAKNFEWRLSFSFTERAITRSFDDTAMKVYILLKMIKVTYIKPFFRGDVFPSYYCKACMLWMKEKTPPELWRTENLLYCLHLCIRQLYEWVNNGCCPDYFIVTNNIYDRKIYGPAKTKLSKILGKLLSKDCRKMLFKLKCCNLGQLLQQDFSNVDIIRNSKLIDRNVTLEILVDYQTYIEEAAKCRIEMLRYIPQNITNLTSCIRQIKHYMQDAPPTLRIDAHHVLLSLLSRAGFCIVSECKENIQSLSQEDVDYRKTLATKCLSLGINTDATSVRLKLCALGTMFGNYNFTETRLQEIGDHRMRYIYSCKTNNSYTLKCNMAFNLNKFKTEKDSTNDLLQNQTSFSVIYLPSEISITPTALKIEMYRSVCAPPALRDEEKHFWYDWAVVDSLMCLHFFQYLNFLMLKIESHKMASVEKMVQVIRTEPYIPNRETELNLLGYCLMRESQVKNAFICFKKSMTTCPHHNAAKFHLGIMFQKFHVARLGR
ncbi:hypothetical protein ACJMK2_003482 [Sinanodonta woodiana]|uniref:Mab-21-like HhH/H2TH-like domain-containing protein n=1 Tax=Sinanodonta woodiana TaxID=1069815 RepID=A0ABD3XYE1_SINWO